MEANFYASYYLNVEKVLAPLLEKVLLMNKTACIFVATEEEIKFLDKILWTIANWLPHTIEGSPIVKDTPIILSTSVDFANSHDIDYLFILNEAIIELEGSYKKAYIIFDAKKDGILTLNRKRWKDFKEKNINLKFYKQEDSGQFKEMQL